MKWSRIAQAWHAAVQAFRDSAASNRRLELAEVERKRLRKKHRYSGVHLDRAVETFILLVLGALIGAFLIR